MNWLDLIGHGLMAGLLSVAFLVALVIFVMLIPPHYDLAIRLREWLDRRDP